MEIKLNDTTFKYTFFKNEIVPSTEAVVPIMSQSLQYGMGVFAGIRGFVDEKGYKIFRLKDHFFRLKNAAKILDLPIDFSFDEFKEIIEELVRKNAPTGGFYIRPFIFSDTDQIGPSIHKGKYHLAVYMLKMEEYVDGDGKLNLCISSYQKYNDNAISSKAKACGAYVNSMLAKHEAYLNGYDDAILLDGNGYVTEMSVGNMLIVHRGRILIPFVGSATLEGITMRSVVELLRESGYDVLETQIDRSTLYAADEVIALGTAVKVKKVDTVDKRTIGTAGVEGPVCEFLRTEYDKVLAGTHKKSEEWLYRFSK